MFKLCCRFKKVSNAPSKTERAIGYLFSFLKIGLQLIIRQKIKAVKKSSIKNLR